MKVIDLLNKIANGEEVPKRIKVVFNEFIYDKVTDRYVNTIEGNHDLLKHLDFYKGKILNSEVEIIKELTITDKIKDLIEEYIPFGLNNDSEFIKELNKILNEGDKNGK